MEREETIRQGARKTRSNSYLHNIYVVSSVSQTSDSWYPKPEWVTDWNISNSGLGPDLKQTNQPPHLPMARITPHLNLQRMRPRQLCPFQGPFHTSQTSRRHGSRSRKAQHGVRASMSICHVSEFHMAVNKNEIFSRVRLRMT